MDHVPPRSMFPDTLPSDIQMVTAPAGYPVTDFSKARKFYGDILGLKETITFEDGGELGWLKYDLAGQTLACQSL
jgi:extradiol dioxygenase family protein